MKVSRKRGKVVLKLDDVERPLLTSILGDLTSALAVDGLDADDPVRQRLFPAAYADVTDEAEFRDLTESALREERLERIGACQAELATKGDLLLDDEAGERWIRTLNDVRLALGTRLDIQDDDPSEAVADDGDGPDAPTRAIYHWLTAVQDSVVVNLMR